MTLAHSSKVFSLINYVDDTPTETGLMELLVASVADLQSSNLRNKGNTTKERAEHQLVTSCAMSVFVRNGYWVGAAFASALGRSWMRRTVLGSYSTGSGFFLEHPISRLYVMGIG